VPFFVVKLTKTFKRRIFEEKLERVEEAEAVMVRASSSKKGGSKGGDKDDAESKQRKRLKTLALDNQLLSDSPAKSHSSLKPSKQVLKHHGTDIIRKSQRKNRFLFSFPGLLAPISAATVGDLDRLSTKNPVLYLNFPQVRF